MDFEKLYIGGRWVPGSSGQFIDVEDPVSMKPFARVPRGAPEDVDRAAEAARAAFPAWAKTSLAERIAVMERFLAVFRSQEEEIIELEIRELGAPWSFAKSSHCEYQYTRVRSYIDLAPSVPLVEKMPLSTVYREPVGVVGCITPWNYPLGQVVQKVIPALLMGNTVVLKPSQHTPLSCYLMAEAFEEAGLPAGVFNMVTGRGGEVGNAMASHPDIDMISFTGSTKGGIEVARNALGTVKRISLELGGKSPDIFLPMDDYDTAVRCCFNSIFLNSGQTCTALSRLIIPKAEEKKIEEALCRIAPEYTVGDPRDYTVKVGPLASLAQYKKVRAYIESGIAAGARVLVGGVPADPTRGYYVAPTIFTDVTPDMAIAREEIFGPVLCVFTYDTTDEAVALANDTAYGLNAAVYGPKAEAIAVARRIQAGNVYINDSPRDTAAPFGGYRQSGIGREGGVYGMLEFTQQKALFDTCKD